MIGRPGAGILPDERAADRAEHPRDRRRRRPARLAQLGQPRAHPRARRAVECRRRDHPALGAADPRDADLAVRRAGVDQAAVDLSATNPAVSLPELARIRSILQAGDLFVVVQDMFLTETAELADVVLPAATWGEKTGTFTNADRTVHLSEKAVDATRRGPRRPGHLPRLRPPDGLPRPRRRSADRLERPPRRRSRRGRSARAGGRATTPASPTSSSAAVRDPVAVHRRGARRYRAPLHRRSCSTPTRTTARPYGHDLATGARRPASSTGRSSPHGRAFLHAADYQPSPEVPDDDYPLLSDHRAHRLPVPHPDQDRPGPGAATRRRPDVWVELARRTTPRVRDRRRRPGPHRAHRAAPSRHRARITGIRPGVVFVPFHYGYWDMTRSRRRTRAANELTLTRWDPVSKQPIVQGRPPWGRAPGARRRARHRRGIVQLAALPRSSAPRRAGPRRRVPSRSPTANPDEPDVRLMCRAARRASATPRRAARAVRAALRRGRPTTSPTSCTRSSSAAPATGGIGLLRDLQDLYLMARRVRHLWTLIGQAAQGARDGAAARGRDHLREETALAARPGSAAG